MRRALLLAALLALIPLGRAQVSGVGITAVTVTWSAPTAYATRDGAATSVTLGTAPTGTLTDGTYHMFIPPDANGTAFGMEVTATVVGGLVTDLEVMNSGSGFVVGSTERLPVISAGTGATTDGTLVVSAVTDEPGPALPSTDIDHYTVWWAPADGPGYCDGANCVRGPYGVAEVGAGATSYTIAAACGNLNIEVRVSTTASAYAPFAMSDPATFTESTGLTCPVLGAPGAPKLSWPKL